MICHLQSFVNGTEILGRPLLCVGTQTEDFGCMNGCLSMYSCTVNSKNDIATSAKTGNDNTCTTVSQSVNMNMDNKLSEELSQPKRKTSPTPSNADGKATCDAITPSEGADSNQTDNVHLSNSFHGNQMHSNSIQDINKHGNQAQDTTILGNSIHSNSIQGNAIQCTNVPAATCSDHMKRNGSNYENAYQDKSNNDDSIHGNSIHGTCTFQQEQAAFDVNVAACMSTNLEGSMQGNSIHGDGIHEDGYHGTSAFKCEAISSHATSTHDDKKQNRVEKGMSTVQCPSIQVSSLNIKEEVAMDQDSNDGLFIQTENEAKTSLIEIEDPNIRINDDDATVCESFVYVVGGDRCENGMEPFAENATCETTKVNEYDEEMSSDYDKQLVDVQSKKAEQQYLSYVHVDSEDSTNPLSDAGENIQEKRIDEEVPTVSHKSVDEELIKCQLCVANLTTRQLYHEHLKEHCSETSPECPICDKSFDRKAHLYTHLQVHSGARGLLKTSHQCLDCNKVFTSKATLKDHISVHTGVNLNHCETCGKSFRYRSQLSKHKLRLHKSFQCKFCKKAFILERHLKEHENTHLGVEPFECTTCGKTFESKPKLNEHKLSHAGKKRFPFKMRGNQFKSKQYLAQHQTIPTVGKPFQCKICLTTFTFQSTLTAHARFHSHARPFKCDSCGKRYKSKQYLLVHNRIHTGEKPYDCKKCEKEFRFHNNFLTHNCKGINKHDNPTKQTKRTEEKTHECHECGKTFDFECNLQLHGSVNHDFMTPYKCDICGATFKYKQHLTRHSCKEKN